MLNLAEYVAARAQLKALGEKIQDTTMNTIGDSSKPEAIQTALALASQYQEEWIQLLYDTMGEVAKNSVEHYNEHLGLDLDVDPTSTNVVEHQFSSSYYGSTLNQRLTNNYGSLQRRIQLSGNVNQKHLGTVYTQTPLYGSQTAIDQRLLLGTIVKIENDVARMSAQQTEHKLIRWTLSHKHAQTDICDDLATQIDHKVAEYLRVNNIDESPKGLYFAEDLPEPPHPNCQCEFGVSKGNQIIKPRPLQRAAQKVRKLLRKLRRR